MSDINPTINRGKIIPAETKCSCGGNGMLQEWLEPTGKTTYKFCAVVFCQNCDKKTKIYSERTFKETRQEAIYEWKARNKKQKKEEK